MGKNVSNVPCQIRTYRKPTFYCNRIREFNIANDEWEAEDNTKDRLPTGSTLNLFVVDGEIYVLNKFDNTLVYREGEDPAWVTLADTQDTYKYGHNFAYSLPYHELL